MNHFNSLHVFQYNIAMLATQNINKYQFHITEEFKSQVLFALSVTWVIRKVMIARHFQFPYVQKRTTGNREDAAHHYSPDTEHGTPAQEYMFVHEAWLL